MSYHYDWSMNKWVYEWSDDEDDFSCYKWNEDDLEFFNKQSENKFNDIKLSHDDSITAKQAINKKRLKLKSDKKKMMNLSKEIGYSISKGKNHMSSNDVKTIKKQVRKLRRETHKEQIKESGIIREKEEFDY